MTASECIVVCVITAAQLYRKNSLLLRGKGLYAVAASRCKNKNQSSVYNIVRTLGPLKP
uniref:Uncharacterized protein n=1 Tax=Anguilla anguilla TaxID=7936 RepID=A0A0E9W5K5_ANGAN